jgi:protein SCO1/2
MASMLGLVLSTVAWAGPSTPREFLAQAGFDQRLDAPLPLDVQLRDAAGRGFALADEFGQVPVILVLAWYSCPNVCSVELRDLAAALKDLTLRPGKDYRVLLVSIDPRDGPAQAQKTRDMLLQQYGGAALGEGLRVLTADDAVVRRLARAIGYHYAYDPAIDQYAHPTGIVVLTSAGRVSRYLFGLTFPRDTLRKALVEAGRGRIGSLVEYVITCCYGFDPQTGKYTLSILRILNYLGIGFLVLLLALVGWLARGERRKALP